MSAWRSIGNPCPAPSRIAGLTVFGALLLAAAVPWPARAEPICRIELWVSADGSDAGVGSRADPLRTLEAARDAARAHPLRAVCSVTISVAGEHRLERTLVLEPVDSGAEGRPVVYRAWPGTRPTLSGAVRVRGWSPYDVDRGIYRARVGALRARQLFVNGRRATRARTTEYNADLHPTADGYRFERAGSDPPAWLEDPAGIEVVTITQWKMMSCPVATVAGRELRMAQPCWKNGSVFPAPWNFRLVSRLENALAFLDEPGEWYLDSSDGWLYYLPRDDEDPAAAIVELPVLETLIEGRGELGRPVHHIRFEGLTFAHATWLGPSGPDGYVSDQSGFHLVGDRHEPNRIGHAQHVVRTPGNVRFRFARNLVFRGNRFVHLGAVALDLGTGTQDVVVEENRFEDVSSAALQLGGVAVEDHHPTSPEQVTRDNRVSDNLIRSVGREYLDAAGIFVGFTTRSTVSHNDIVDVPWSGIAIGWGWGLLDPGSFPGLPHAVSGQWGQWDTPTPSRGNRIVANRIERFLMELWDGGAIYSNGQQGTSMEDGELIARNVAVGKRPEAGGNTFYTDGGSRYVTLLENVSLDDPEGILDFGPCGLPSSLELCFLTEIGLPYGLDAGGCVPFGDIHFRSNYFLRAGFYDICGWPSPPPVDVTAADNHFITGADDVPVRLLRAAGRRRPEHSDGPPTPPTRLPVRRP